MKNILFATTALVATAGIASAEVAGSGPGTVNISGWAEMGVIGGSEIESQFWTDIDVEFRMSGTADNGLTFGAGVDLDENGAFSGTTEGGEFVFVSYGAATLTMGDTDGAFDKALTEVNYASGSIDDSETAHAGFSGNGGVGLFGAGVLMVPGTQLGTGLDAAYDGQIARFDYAFDGITASVSAEIDDTGAGDPIWGLGVAYAGEFSGVAVGFGLGYQATADFGGSDTEISVWGLSADAGFSNGVTVGLNYSQMDIEGVDDTLDHGAIGIGYEMNAIAVGLNYGHYTSDDEELASGFGLAASYDLGGGLVGKFGYGSSSLDSGFATLVGSEEEFNTWSLGLAMSF